MKKILIYLVIIFAVVAAVSIFVIGKIFFPGNSAETSSDGGAKNLKTRVYQTDVVTAEREVRQIIPTLSTYGRNWKIVGENFDAENGKIIRAEIPVIIFTDDLEVFIKETEDKVLIDARSNSRVGSSDWGENARHINQLLKALDEKYEGQNRER